MSRGKVFTTNSGGADPTFQAGVDPQGLAAMLPKFRLAVAKTRNGVTDSKVLFVGDSITAGNGGSAAHHQSFNSFPSRIRLDSSVQALPSMGIYPNVQDDRFALGTGWAGYAGYGWGSASAFLASGAAGALVYTAGSQNGTYDTFDVYYMIFSGGGTITAQATGGAGSGSVSTNGSPAVGIVTVSAGSAGTGNTVTIANPSGQVFILGIEGRLSSARLIRMANVGVNSSTASGSAAGAWQNGLYGGGVGGSAMILAYGPDLSFVGLGTNDAYTLSATKAVYKAAMLNIVNTCRASGDVALLTPPPSNDPTVEGLVLQYVDALYELGSTLGVPVLDVHARFGGVFQSAVMADTYHPNDLGYWDMGGAIQGFLNGITGYK